VRDLFEKVLIERGRRVEKTQVQQPDQWRIVGSGINAELAQVAGGQTFVRTHAGWSGEIRVGQEILHFSQLVHPPPGALQSRQI